MSWSNDHFERCELGMVSQNSTTTASMGRALTMPLAYICTVVPLLGHPRVQASLNLEGLDLAC